MVQQQQQLLQVLSVAVYNHYKRIYHSSVQKGTEGDLGSPKAETEDDDSVELEKSNVLLMGSTGLVTKASALSCLLYGTCSSGGEMNCGYGPITFRLL
ncbi:CLP protease regulatory subunit CLPX1, mitochondrial-like [Magnolia sinica]|uniref:CLP protease regulatory subunit CLPX1, mitochondrial-like n=1 Tax=Magnolia sinica TaxID=86752 RepID=UPI00265B07EB|nr:CLP protease regulatory subunit CLPX1, mitochondrial-like [Magnolia sinica]